MARFVFEYAAVLRKRELEERRITREVAEIEQLRLALEARLRGLRDRLLGDRASVRSAVTPGVGAIDPRYLRMQAGSAHRSRIEAERAAIELAGVLGRLGEARTRLVCASTARRSMELLRDARLEAFRREALKREASELDDISVMRRGRGGASGVGSAAIGGTAT